MAPQSLDPELKQLLSHHSGLVDAASRKAVDENTKLVALYKPNDYNDLLLLSLTGTAKPAEPCSLMLEHGLKVPASLGLRVTFYRLVGFSCSILSTTLIVY